MPLTATTIKAAKYGPDLRRLPDGGGLYIRLTPGGSKLWRLDFRMGGKAQVLSFGAWPDVSIDEARGLRAAARLALAAGRDPRGAKDLSTAQSFGDFADAHIRRMVELGRAANTVKNRKRALGYPAENGSPAFTGQCTALRPMPIVAVTAAHVIEVLRPFEADGRLETAKKLRIAISHVMRRAIVAGVIAYDPTAALGEEDVRAPVVEHYPAIVDQAGFRGLLAAIACYRGDRLGVVRDALRLLALTALRPAEVRLSRWSDVDLKARTWTIPAARQKRRKEHVSPLSDWAVDILTALKARTGSETWIFPSPRGDKPLSAQACNAALESMGYRNQHCAHGFRSSFRTLASEARVGKLPRWSDKALKVQMSHAIGDSVAQAYDRSAHWAERVELAQWWSLEIEHMERVARLVG